MNTKASPIMVVLISTMLLAVGCATVKGRWEIAKLSGTIAAYEEFLQLYPDSEYADQARSRLEELNDWKSSQSKDTVAAYEEFLQKHPEGEFTDNARIRIEYLTKLTRDNWKITREKDTLAAYEWFLQNYPDSEYEDQARARVEAMRKDLPDWERALKKNTISAYAAFLKKHPDSPFADKAKGKIVDLEVSDILSRPHGQLPAAKRVSRGGGRTYSVVNIHNDTSYNLTIRYSGPDSFKVVFSPGEKGSIEYLLGMYRVVASVDDAHVKNYAGEAESDGGNYEVEYYIRGPYGGYRYSAPRIYVGSAPKFEAWKCKRRVPDYLK